MKAHFSTLIFLSLIVFSFQSCDDPVNLGSNQVDVTFKVEYDGEPLVMSLENYVYPGGIDMRISRFSVYLSNFKLENTSSEGVHFLNFADINTSTSNAEKGTTVALSGDENGSYSNISFDIGISQELNAMIPADFPEDSPLSKSGEYWPGWNSFIFAKTEGKLDTDNDGMYETNMSLHLGSDDARRTISLNGTFKTGEANNSEIVIDLKNLFVGENDAIYDVIATPAIHQLNQVDQLIELSNNLTAAFSAQ